MNTTDKTQDNLTENLIQIGSVWARHGLGIGRSALEASAKTLSATASVLKDLSDNFAKATAEKAEQPKEG